MYTVYPFVHREVPSTYLPTNIKYVKYILFDRKLLIDNSRGTVPNVQNVRFIGNKSALHNLIDFIPKICRTVIDSRHRTVFIDLLNGILSPQCLTSVGYRACELIITSNHSHIDGTLMAHSHRVVYIANLRIYSALPLCSG